jgi:hypothetical protein
LESGEVPFQVEVVPLAPLVSRVISEISMGRSISDVRIEHDVPVHLAAKADASGSTRCSSISSTTRCASRRPEGRSA